MIPRASFSLCSAAWLAVVLLIGGCGSPRQSAQHSSPQAESASATLEIFGLVSRDRPRREWRIASWSEPSGFQAPPAYTDSRPMLTLSDFSAVRMDRIESQVTEHESVERDVLVLILTDEARERLRSAHNPALRAAWPMIAEWNGRVISATFIAEGYGFHGHGEVPLSMTEGDDPSRIFGEIQAALPRTARE